MAARWIGAVQPGGRWIGAVPGASAPSGFTLTAAAGTFTETGISAGLRYGRRLSAATGTFAGTGNAAGLRSGRRLTSAAGTFVETGNAATLIYTPVGSYVLTAATGSLALAGNAATLTRSGAFTLPAGAGSFVLAGTAAGLRKASVLHASAGSFAGTGVAAGLRVGRRLASGTGTYTVTGVAATLIYTPVGSHVLAAGAGAFTLGGNAAGLRVSRVLHASAGSFALTGNPASIRVGRRLAASAGVFTLTGSSATFIYTPSGGGPGHTHPGCWGGYPWGSGPWGGIPLGGGGGGGGTTPPTLDGDTLIEAIISYLGGIPGVGDTATGIYRTRPKRGWSYPFLIVNQINASSEMTNQPDYMEEEEFQFSVISDDDIQASAVANAARGALLPRTNRKLIFADGYDMVRMPSFHGRLIEQPARGPTNSNVWMYTFGFKFLVGRLV